MKIGLHVRNVPEMVKFNRTENLCLCLLFTAQRVVGSHSSFFLPKKFTKVNLENQLPPPFPSDVKEVEQRAVCPLRSCCFFFCAGHQ